MGNLIWRKTHVASQEWKTHAPTSVDGKQGIVNGQCSSSLALYHQERKLNSKDIQTSTWMLLFFYYVYLYVVYIKGKPPDQTVKPFCLRTSSSNASTTQSKLSRLAWHSSEGAPTKSHESQRKTYNIGWFIEIPIKTYPIPLYWLVNRDSLCWDNHPAWHWQPPYI